MSESRVLKNRQDKRLTYFANTKTVNDRHQPNFGLVQSSLSQVSVLYSRSHLLGQRLKAIDTRDDTIVIKIDRQVLAGIDDIGFAQAFAFGARAIIVDIIPAIGRKSIFNGGAAQDIEHLILIHPHAQFAGLSLRDGCALRQINLIHAEQ